MSQDKRLQGNPSALGTFKLMASDHSSQGYGDMLRGQHQIEKVNTEYQLQRQSGLDAKDAVLGSDQDFDRLKANIDGAGRHMGLEPQNVDTRTHILLQDAAQKALSGYKDPTQALGFIDSQKKRGIFDDDEANQLSQKYAAVDGKVASKDANNSIDKILADAQENSHSHELRS